MKELGQHGEIGHHVLQHVGKEPRLVQGATVMTCLAQVAPLRWCIALVRLINNFRPILSLFNILIFQGAYLGCYNDSTDRILDYEHNLGNNNSPQKLVTSHLPFLSTFYNLHFSIADVKSIAINKATFIMGYRIPPIAIVAMTILMIQE